MKTATSIVSLVPHAQSEGVDMVERRRAKARARTIAGIGGQRPADDVRHYSGGHVWVRHRDHETLVLKVLQGRNFE